ncbi:N-acetylglucosamine-6-phosphate deacetylase [Salinibacillus aidingensis]|uniref:N-acetylglucosamine-6-phosphate deacetylase n=1 Tax=Salinibacillus aidingensis TaxID=237684 RepID=A0ABN1AXW3_9BACI
MSNQPLLIKNVTIYTEDEAISNGNILINNGVIQSIDRMNEESETIPEDARIIDGSEMTAIPGFIDGHIHGAYGADAMDSTEEALDTMASFLPKEGTTSFLATTMTNSTENIEKALANAENYKQKDGYAEMIGVHLEGPFVEKSKAGAQPQEHILEPDLEKFKKWQEMSGNTIRTITMAPEHDTDGSFMQELASQGVNVSAGHTDANFEGIKRAIPFGLHQLTHLCNQMNGIHHRDIGAVGAAFQLENLQAELIADGVHVAPEMLQLIYRNVGSDRLILITDAMRAKGLPDGDYELGGQPVIVSNGKAVLENGTLAGSILKMRDAAKRMLEINDADIRDIIKMTAVNPAKQVDVYDRKGSISKGKDADILLIDDDLNIQYSLCRGTIAYKGE